VLAVVSDDEWHSRSPHPQASELADRLRGLHGILALSGHEFGHRVYEEGLRFAAILAATGEHNVDTALDLFTVQKILPRIHGARRRTEPVLLRLGAFAVSGSTQGPGAEVDPTLFTETPALPRTFDKARRMLEIVRVNQFVSFAE
jgi:5-methylcytosine-specific restriction protein B